MSLLHTPLTLVPESAFMVDIASSAVAILSHSGYDERLPRLTSICMTGLISYFRLDLEGTRP